MAVHTTNLMYGYMLVVFYSPSEASVRTIAPQQRVLFTWTPMGRPPSPPAPIFPSVAPIDSDVLASTGIDIHILAKLVASTGARVNFFPDFFDYQEYHEQTVLEVGVLRYPDIDQPYFKVYRLKLTAWCDRKRVLNEQHDYQGITGIFTVRKYKPRDRVISGMKEEVRRKAVQEAEGLFS